MKGKKIDAKKLALRLLIVFFLSAAVSCLALWASGLPSAIRNGEQWPRMARTVDRDYR